MPESQVDLDVLKLHTTADPLRRLVNSGFIDPVERNEVCTLTAQGESKARFVFGLLRTSRVNLVQVAVVLAKQASACPTEDIHWVPGGC